MFYIFRVNNALALLNINPQVLNPQFRRFTQITGKSTGASPQEVALVLASQLPVIYRAQANPLTAKTWIRKRKINPRDPSVKQALEDLGWYDLIDY